MPVTNNKADANKTEIRKVSRNLFIRISLSFRLCRLVGMAFIGAFYHSSSDRESEKAAGNPREAGQEEIGQKEKGKNETRNSKPTPRPDTQYRLPATKSQAQRPLLRNLSVCLRQPLRLGSFFDCGVDSF